MGPHVADLCTNIDSCKETHDYVKLLHASNMARIYDLSMELL